MSISNNTNLLNNLLEQVNRLPVSGDGGIVDKDALYFSSEEVGGVIIGKFTDISGNDITTEIVSQLYTLSDSKQMKAICFTIGGSPFAAEEGMTWNEWINSDYNVDGYVVILTETVVDSSGVGHVALNNMLVSSSSIIIENTKYRLEYIL